MKSQSSRRRALRETAALVVLSACSSGSPVRPTEPDVAIAYDGGGGSSGSDAGRDAKAKGDSGPTQTEHDAGTDATTGAERDAQAEDAAADASEDALANESEAGPVLDAGEDAFVATNPGTDAAMVEPQCRPYATLSSPRAASGIAPFDAEPLLTVTGDELTAAWVEDAGAGTGRVFVADRASSDAPFGTAQEVVTDASDGGSAHGYFAFERVALTEDGMRLIATSVDQTRFAWFVRTGRTDAFLSIAQESSFRAITGSLNPGEILGDPVLSGDGTDLVYSRYGRSQTLSIYESTSLGATPWSPGSPQGNDSVAIIQGARKRPLSMSSDRLTLFVQDEADHQVYGVIRAAALGGDFFSAQRYGAFDSLQANAACTRYYYVAQSGSGYEVEQVEVQK